MQLESNLLLPAQRSRLWPTSVWEGAEMALSRETQPSFCLQAEGGSLQCFVVSEVPRG